MNRLVFRLLGPWEVATEQGPIHVPVGRLRVLLTSLVLSAGEPVGLDRLVEHLWPEQPPCRARNTLHTYLGRLRKLLGPELIRNHPSGGYLLDVEADAVDVHRFRDLLSRADQAGCAETELALLREALALWRGRPFADMYSTWLDREVLPGLSEAWFAATGRRIDLELADGRSEGLIAELRDLVCRFPTRESLWVRLITAQHRAGRRAEALGTYQRVRTLLRDELGIDPGEELVALQHAILLGGAPQPAVPTSRTTPPTAPPTAEWKPRQLPHDVGTFTGRASELADLDALLTHLDGRAPVIAAVNGTAGVGKTTLAVHWAHRVAHLCPDGQLHLNLRGYGPDEPVAPPEAAVTLLRALGVHSELIPSDPEARFAALRTALAGRRVLMLLDNARDADQVRPLLPGTPGLVIVTSRSQLRGLSVRDGAHQVPVGRLSRGESVALLASVVGAPRVAAEAADARRLAQLCDHLPLALAIVAERVRRADTLAEVATALEHSRLDTLTSGEDDPHTDLRRSLSWSYLALGPDAAAMFLALGPHSAADVELRSAAALADLPVEAARSALDQLSAAHLVERGRGRRYALPELTRLYARELALANGYTPDHRMRRPDYRPAAGVPRAG